MDMQKLINAMGDAGRQQRSNYHLTLGQLVETLERASSAAVVSYDFGAHPGRPLSYRGYYSDLSFAISDKPVSVSDFLAKAKSSLGKTFEGYKGGDFLMEADTPLWASDYGTSSGRAIIAATEIGTSSVILVTKEID